jgi:hypothetical protein
LLVNRHLDRRAERATRPGGGVLHGASTGALSPQVLGLKIEVYGSRTTSRYATRGAVCARPTDVNAEPVPNDKVAILECPPSGIANILVKAWETLG